MPTRTDKQSKTSRAVPGSPKTFSPQAGGTSTGTAWDSLHKISKGAGRAKADTEAMLALAQGSIRARSIRNHHLPNPMFGEPAWDMLLALYVDGRSNARQTVSRLSKFSGSPATTAVRWIDYLERAEFVIRQANPTDKRVVFIRLTEKGCEAIEAYFAALLEQGWAPPAQS